MSALSFGIAACSGITVYATAQANKLPAVSTHRNRNNNIFASPAVLFLDVFHRLSKDRLRCRWSAVKRLAVGPRSGDLANQVFQFAVQFVDPWMPLRTVRNLHASSPTHLLFTLRV
ncbi:hypothetical protein EV401DRAFT_589624 [Pisolithus croceorrhizus]|nr:hypothetical protein EV401DRAFT_589624 [Pisolithus croceorrhizus]